MPHVKINENFTEFHSKYNNPKFNFVFKNHLLSYEYTIIELKPNEETDFIPKNYFIKKITPKPHKLTSFEDFLKRFLSFQNNNICPCFLKLLSVYKKEDEYYFVQKYYGSSLSDLKPTLTELENLGITKEIIKFYSQLIEEPDLVKELMENNFPLRVLALDNIFYYRKCPKKGKEDLQRQKLKIDMLTFDESDSNLPKLGADSFHLKEFEQLMSDLFCGRIGLCTRNLFRKMKENCKWKDLFAHPIFNIDITNTPDNEFWRISAEDHLEMKKNESLFMKTNKNNNEENKSNENEEDKDLAITNKKNWKNSLENEKIDENEKNKANDQFHRKLSDYDQSKNSSHIKKSQIKPINTNNNNREIQLEDQNNGIVSGEEASITLSKQQAQSKNSTCGDCRCI